MLEIRYGVQGSFTNLVVEASPDEVVIYLFSPGVNREVDRFTAGPPGRDAWSRMDLALELGEAVGNATLAIDGNLAQSDSMPIPEFNPGNMPLSVNVGPWFQAGMAPPEGCFYDLDDLLIELLP